MGKRWQRIWQQYVKPVVLGLVQGWIQKKTNDDDSGRRRSQAKRRDG